MGLAVSVHAKVTGRRRSPAPNHPLQLDLSAGETTVAALLGAVVHAELDAFSGRVREEGFLRVLTEPALASGLAEGRVLLGDREMNPAPSRGDAVAEVLSSFADGVFKVFLDDAELHSADEVVVVREGAELLFLRLVALAGG